MRRRWIVDASNVVGSRPDGWWRDRSLGLFRLLDEIVRWRDEAGDEVVLFADGHPSARVPEGQSYGVDVRYAHSNARDAADEQILECVAADPEPSSLTVVTSDRALRKGVAEFGAAGEGARSFLARLADIEPRRRDRAVLAHFGVDESALLGRGGEARVFAMDEGRVLRLPHIGVDTAALDWRRRLLDTIATSDPPVATPVVIDHVEIDGRVAVIERRLPGENAIEALGHDGTDRAGLVRHHLDVANRIFELPCPTDRFGELWGSGAISTRSFREWSNARLGGSLRQAGDAFAHVDPSALTEELLGVLPDPEPDRPGLVHLDAFLGNMLARDDRITALLDFGPMTIGGPSHLDPLIAIAYLAPEITPTANAADRETAEEWAEEIGLAGAVRAAERWVAAYWTGALDDQRLQRWCRRILGHESTPVVPGSRRLD